MQGGINSGANFQSAVESLLDVPVINRIDPRVDPSKQASAPRPNRTNAYIDDVYARDADGRELLITDRHIGLVIDRDGARIDLGKLRFAKGSLPYLGRIRTPRGSFTQPGMLLRALRLKDLTTAKKVMTWAGVMEYLEPHFPGIRTYLAKVRKCTAGKTKHAKIELTETARDAVEKTRSIIATGGIQIGYFDAADRTIYLQTDASKDGWAAVFFQKNAGIVRVDGGPFSETESRRSARLLELMAVCKAVTRAADILFGYHIILVTDSKSNTWYFRSQPTIPKDKRTLDLLDKIDGQHIQIAECIYLQGEKMILADYISRAAIAHEGHDYSIPSYDELREMHKLDHDKFLMHVGKIMESTGCTNVTNMSLSEINKLKPSTRDVEREKLESAHPAKPSPPSQRAVPKPKRMKTIDISATDQQPELDEKKMLDHGLVISHEQDLQLKTDMSCEMEPLFQAQQEDDEIVEFLHLRKLKLRTKAEQQMFMKSPYFKHNANLSTKLHRVLHHHTVFKKREHIAQVIPKSLRARTLKAWHLRKRNHNPVHAMKAYMPREVWWPKIKQDITKFVEECPVCAMQNQQATQVELFSNLPFACGEVFHADYFHFEGFTQAYLVVADQLSSYVWVEPCDEDSASASKAFARIFAQVTPFILITDNGSPFDSDQFADDIKSWGTAHFRALPYQPKQNGLAERSVQLIKNEIRGYFRELDLADIAAKEIPDAWIRKAEKAVRYMPRDDLDGWSSHQVWIGAESRTCADLPELDSQKLTEARNRARQAIENPGERRAYIENVVALREAIRTQTRIKRAQAAAVRSLRKMCESNIKDSTRSFTLNQDVKILATALPPSARGKGKFVVGAKILAVPSAGGRSYQVLLHGEKRARDVHVDGIISENDGRARERTQQYAQNVRSIATDQKRTDNLDTAVGNTLPPATAEVKSGEDVIVTRNSVRNVEKAKRLPHLPRGLRMQLENVIQTKADKPDEANKLALKVLRNPLFRKSKELNVLVFAAKLAHKQQLAQSRTNSYFTLLRHIIAEAPSEKHFKIAEQLVSRIEAVSAQIDAAGVNKIIEAMRQESFEHVGSLRKILAKH